MQEKMWGSNKIYWFDGYCFLPRYLNSKNLSVDDVQVEDFNDAVSVGVLNDLEPD